MQFRRNLTETIWSFFMGGGTRVWMGQGGREGGLGVQTKGLQGVRLVRRMGGRVGGTDKRFATCLFRREDGERV